MAKRNREVTLKNRAVSAVAGPDDPTAALNSLTGRAEEVSIVDRSNGQNNVWTEVSFTLREWVADPPGNYNLPGGIPVKIIPEVRPPNFEGNNVVVYGNTFSDGFLVPSEVYIPDLNYRIWKSHPFLTFIGILLVVVAFIAFLHHLG